MLFDVPAGARNANQLDASYPGTPDSATVGISGAALERKQGMRNRLPVPIADSVSPGDLVVRTTADINLVPDVARSTGLMPRTNAEPLVGATTGTMSEFHFRTSDPEAIFAADRTLRSREISHDVLTSINFEEADAEVEQQIEYDVKHEPIQGEQV